jgi:hypothetical protein
MSNFWLYERNNEFDAKLQEWRNFIETRRTELEWVEIGLCNEILEANKDNSIINNSILGNKINTLNTWTSRTEKNVLFKNYETIRWTLKKLYYQKFFKKWISICPYCGCNYIFDWKSLWTSTELDHYLNRDQFPQFAGNPYNIIPVCRNCNNKKSNNCDIDKVSDIIWFYPSTQYPISWLYLVNKWEDTELKTNYPKLFDMCNIENRFIANRNQSKLQVMYENILNDSSYYWVDIKKALFNKKIESEHWIKSIPYWNFDKQFYQRLFDNNGLEI